MRTKNVIFNIVIVILFNYKADAQSQICTPIRESILNLSDSIGNIYVINESEPSKIYEHQRFQNLFATYADAKVLRKVNKESGFDRKFTINECLDPSFLISRAEGDSLRKI